MSVSQHNVEDPLNIDSIIARLLEGEQNIVSFCWMKIVHLPMLSQQLSLMFSTGSARLSYLATLF